MNAKEILNQAASSMHEGFLTRVFGQKLALLLSLILFSTQAALEAEIQKRCEAKVFDRATGHNHD